MFSRQERIEIFTSRFHGRRDVFARRWERSDGAKGYAPVYTNKTKTSYQPLTIEWIEAHLLGNDALGVYPLLSDNTSYFIAADFDGEGWRDSIGKFLGVARKYGLQVAIERSRSGNGAHAWLFFTEPYPASKSRKIFFGLLREAGIIGLIDKNESFDRLFPNQDYHSGKGLGNLIMFPLQGAARKVGNSVFVDPDNNFLPYDDQWQFLSDEPRLTFQELDAHLATITGGAISESLHSKPSKLILTISNAISIPKESIPAALVSYLREELNMLNVEYFVKERSGLPIFGIEKYITTVTSDDNFVFAPRGFLPKLIVWLDEHKISYSIKDKKTIVRPMVFENKFKLFDFQKKAVDAFMLAENGILVAPAGSGKTIMGLAIVIQKGQPAMILTHRRQIYDQWLERVEHGFGIAKKDIGQICGTKKKAELPVTVAMVETLARLKDWDDIPNMFGTVILDECHHVPAKMFREVVSRFKAKYRFGFTATPERKYNDSKLISAYLGEIVYTVDKNEVKKGEDDIVKQSLKSEPDHVMVTSTSVEAPFGDTPRQFPLIAKVVANDSGRNALIVADIARAAGNGKRVLVLTERKEHAEMLKAHMRRDFETILFSGDLSARQKKWAWQRIKSGRFQILIATGQILGEGTDIANLDVLVIAFPVSFHGKLAQYVGRIRREGGAKIVYDYRDQQVPLLEKMWKKRAAFYRKNDFIISQSRETTRANESEKRQASLLFDF
jgi:superfamily II DNA or RNA helicase